MQSNKGKNAWEYLAGETSFKMLKTKKRRTIEEFYEALKDVVTPFGTCYLARLKTMTRNSLIFGPNEQGTYYFFYFGMSGKKGYCGFAVSPFAIADVRNNPTITCEKMKEMNKNNEILPDFEPYELQNAIFDVILEYADSGEVRKLGDPKTEEQ